MDDVNVDYSPLIKHILLQVNFTVPIDDGSVLRFKFEEEDQLDVYLHIHTSPQISEKDTYIICVNYVIREGEEGMDIFWNMETSTRSIYTTIEDEIRNILLDHGIEADHINSAFMAGSEGADGNFVLAQVNIGIHDPRIIIPEPETEGGYESWMM